MKISEEKTFVRKWIEKNSVTIASMSDLIFNYSEPGLREYKSSKLLVNLLKDHDFAIIE